jgi:hypothetical protein
LFPDFTSCLIATLSPERLIVRKEKNSIEIKVVIDFSKKKEKP